MPTTDNLVLAVLAMLDLDDFSKNYCDMKNAEKNPTLCMYLRSGTWNDETTFRLQLSLRLINVAT